MQDNVDYVVIDGFNDALHRLTGIVREYVLLESLLFEVESNQSSSFGSDV